MCYASLYKKRELETNILTGFSWYISILWLTNKGIGIRHRKIVCYLHLDIQQCVGYQSHSPRGWHGKYPDGRRRTMYLLQARPVTTLKRLYKMISYMLVYGLQQLASGCQKSVLGGNTPKNSYHIQTIPNKVKGAWTFYTIHSSSRIFRPILNR